MQYKASRHNIVAEALSRRDADQSILLAISMPQLSLFDDIQKEQRESGEIKQLISQVQNSTTTDSWSFKQGLLFYKNSISIQTLSIYPACGDCLA